MTYRAHHLTAGWSLALIPPGQESPLAGHRGGEVAVDVDQKIFYGWEIFAATYGLDSMIGACEKYISAVESLPLEA